MRFLLLSCANRRSLIQLPLPSFPTDVSDTSIEDGVSAGVPEQEVADPNHGRVFHPYQCHLHQIIHIGPGGALQPIHRDGGYCGFDFGPKVEVEISTIWALSDFTEDVGPTRGVRRFCSNFVHTVS
eukprot:COSAG02_NODE_195_length_29750_cov_79.793329_14_plen_126_part_00